MGAPFLAFVVRSGDFPVLRPFRLHHRDEREKWGTLSVYTLENSDGGGQPHNQDCQTDDWTREKGVSSREPQECTSPVEG